MSNTGDIYLDVASIYSIYSLKQFKHNDVKQSFQFSQDQ